MIYTFITIYTYYFLKFIYFIFIYYFWLHWVFVGVHGLSLVAASGGYSSLRCAGFSLQQFLLLRSTGSRCTCFSSCGTRAQLLCGMWNLPRPGLEPVSPALAGGLLTTEPPGKPCTYYLITIMDLQINLYFKRNNTAVKLDLRARKDRRQIKCVCVYMYMCILILKVCLLKRQKYELCEFSIK